MGGNPLGEIDPYGLFKVQSIPLPNRGFAGKRRYKFEFTFGCKVQWILDRVNPRGKLGKIARAQKGIETFITSGENDVGSESLCSCRNVDSELQDIYTAKGYSLSGQTLSRNQAESLLTEFEEHLKYRDEKECSDCKVAYEAYPWGQLLDLADERGFPPLDGFF